MLSNLSKLLGLISGHAEYALGPPLAPKQCSNHGLHCFPFWLLSPLSALVVGPWHSCLQSPHSAFPLSLLSS